MQGFNMGRYRPYDSDPRKESFNGRTGTRALGKRERKQDDQGVLIVRFELPFNVWCDACEAHIGQGVRYNAEKRQVGAYYSTPIFAFRCKKTCCQTWMEIQTDPKHARYVIAIGAREQNKEWDPAENGGHAIHETEPKEEERDPFASVEKAVEEKERAKRQASRLLQLQEAATARSSDPYALNSNLRNQFRTAKKQRLQLEAKDEALRKRIGWNSDKPLAASVRGSENDTEANHAIEHWARERDDAAGVGKSRIATPYKSSSAAARRSDKSSTSSATASLAKRVIANTRKKEDPFQIKKG